MKRHILFLFCILDLLDLIRLSYYERHVDTVRTERGTTACLLAKQSQCFQQHCVEPESRSYGPRTRNSFALLYLSYFPFILFFLFLFFLFLLFCSSIFLFLFSFFPCFSSMFILSIVYFNTISCQWYLVSITAMIPFNVRSNLGRILAGGSSWRMLPMRQSSAPRRTYSTSLGRMLAGELALKTKHCWMKWESDCFLVWKNKLRAPDTFRP